MAKEKAAKSGDVALAGRDGAALAALVSRAEDVGTEVLNRILSQAITRLASRGAGAVMAVQHIFNGEEAAELTRTIGKAISTGSLLGHYRIRERQIQGELAKGIDQFAEGDDIPFMSIQSETLPLLNPESAIQYFKSLIPRLGVDPIRWLPVMQRTAMTLAAATEKTTVEKVQRIVLQRIESGEGFSTAPADIQEVLDAVGVTPANPQYSQMVFRTNTMDSYNVGQQLELEQPDVKEFFPAWHYLGIRDGREGDDHRPRFDNYYPNSLPFAIVRGERVWNCRCTFVPVDKYEWARLRARGVDFAPFYPIAA